MTKGGEKGRVSVAEQTINPRLSVDAQIYDYLHYCEYKKQRTPDTLKTKYYHIAQFARENDINDLCEITNYQLDDWCSIKLEDGLKPKTLNGHIDDIVGCLKFLKKKRGRSVALDFEAIERYQTHEGDDNEDLASFSADQILLIKEHCGSLLEKLAFSITFESAMRLHEVTHLCVEDIRTDEKGKTHFRIVGKGNKKRTTFALPETLKLLERWLLLAGITEGYVFPSPVREGRPYTREQFRKIINRPIRRAGFEIGSPQTLRRSAISESLENGMPLPKVSKWVGHTDSRITLKYYYKYNRERMQEQHQTALQKALVDAEARRKTLTKTKKPRYSGMALSQQ